MKEKVLSSIKNNKQWLILYICLIVFLIILINVLNGNIEVFDAKIYEYISSLKSNFMTRFFKSITRFGDAEILIIIAVICLIFIKNKKIGASTAINLASIGLLNHILKIIIQRPRPPIEFRMVEESSFSFPSGHSMASMAFYGLIIYFVFKHIKNKPAKITICTALSIFIVFIGISRIYLGVHYASDVIAGFIASIAYLIIYIRVVLKLIERNKKSIDKKKII